MKRIATIAALGLIVAAPGASRGQHQAGADGEVRAVSVLAAPGKVAVVIDLQGAVDVQDFTLSSPAASSSISRARLSGAATCTTATTGRDQEHPVCAIPARRGPHRDRSRGVEGLPDQAGRQADPIELGTDVGRSTPGRARQWRARPRLAGGAGRRRDGHRRAHGRADSGFQSAVNTSSYNADPIVINSTSRARGRRRPVSGTPHHRALGRADIEDVGRRVCSVQRPHDRRGRM